jgi:hypothetical protein
LSVTVHGDEHFAAGMIKSCHHCRGLPEIPLEVDGPNPLIFLC